MKKISNFHRVLLLAASVLMIGVYFVPFWQILMWAPQYPEWLSMQIWLAKITGDVEIINGLNHYIGMKEIDASMFPEFAVMPWILGGLIGFGVLAATIGRRYMVWIFLLLLVSAGTAGLVDFYLWGYDYGHNLDPHAAIKVPGMAYQPPLIGTKELLNFIAYSAPDWGGWLLATSGLMVILVVVREYFFFKKGSDKMKLLLYVLLSVFAVSCDAQTKPIRFGKDACAQCRMIISDPRFGAELVTDKGKVFVFDDLNCYWNYRNNKALKAEEIAHSVVVIFNKPGTFKEADQLCFLQSGAIRSPMGSGMAAFDGDSVCKAEEIRLKAVLLSWEGVAERLR